MRYEPGQGREWALATLEGCCGCVMPTFTSDLSGLNEAAIRHDVALEKEYGMSAVLLVSECGTTPEEMRRFVTVAVDEAGDDLVTVLQASEPTLRLAVESAQEAERAGVDLVLLSYPHGFYPRSEDEVVDFTRAFSEQTALGVMIFVMNLWNFGRLHPAGFSIHILERFVEEIPNVVAFKNELGKPGVGGIAEVFERFRDVVVVTDPFEMNCPAWVRNYGMRFMGTSNYELMADQVPAFFELLRKGEFDEAMRIYWRLHPARLANAALTGEVSAGTSMIHRLLWKYQGWLVGFNGGPIRPPAHRINDTQMRRTRQSMLDSGLPVTEEPDHAFFAGRNPA